MESLDARREAATRVLRSAGARFAFVFGSQARGTARESSDLDVGAWWPASAPNVWDIDAPAGVDVVDVKRAPLELAGRIACEGTLLFDDDPDERVHWVASTRKIWLDERDRFERSHREFLKAVAHG